jgi:hypothetical protein
MLRAVSFALLLAACSHPAAPPDRLALAMPDTISKTSGSAGSAEWFTLVAIAADDHVRIFPDTPLEHQDFTIGKPEYDLHLDVARIVDGTGREVSACRGGAVLSEGHELAHVTADGFADGKATIQIARDGNATLVRSGETQHMRFTPGIDPCTAALMFYLIPVPRAG